MAYGELIVRLIPIRAATVLSVFAVFNGLGRPVAGFLADRFGVVWVMIVTYTIQATTLLLFHTFAVTLPTLYVAVAFLGWGFAVTLAMFPTLTSLCFGTERLGSIYGMVFAAYGFAALAPVVGSRIFDVTGSYTPIFVSTGIMALI